MPRTSRGRFLHKHLFIVTGPAGCGKTTVAKHLSKLFDLPYLEGDNYHPQENVEKMRAGVPLADADRWDWLVNLREAAEQELDTGCSGVVLTCSALKRKYRDVIRIAQYNEPSLLIHFIYLRASEEVLLQRVAQRQGHYMKQSMVQSQLQSLEEPRKEYDVHSIDVSGTPNEVQTMAFETVRAILAQDIDQGTR
ncbi:shikimate kinase [Microthyrium microscopicum]|uniref:Gluconokinase n=1 Tax=Microthyrium microscopicum TaxID=703497 RepID=A0A6A6U6R8_9PEZI|nr:shikimate kinase [Microthyrium microscopicum]